MLLRIRGPDGMIRLTVEPTTTFGELGDQVGTASLASRSGLCTNPSLSAGVATSEHGRHEDNHDVELTERK